MIPALVSSALVGVLYTYLYGPAGAVAGPLLLFVQSILYVTTYPVKPETNKAQKEREQVYREVAALVLITAFAGAGLAKLLVP